MASFEFEFQQLMGRYEFANAQHSGQRHRNPAITVFLRVSRYVCTSSQWFIGSYES